MSTSLAELQRNFVAHLYSDDDTVLADIAETGQISAKGRMQIYRNNARLILTDMLIRTYPGVVAMVDEKFFRYAADAFIKTHPPAGTDLNAYGAELPDFLGGFAPLKAHPYIADLARLEWARHEAYLAADDFTGLRHPALRLVKSDWPIDRLWQMARPGYDGDTPDLSSGGAYLAVARDGIHVFHTALDEELFALLAGDDATLAAAPSGRLDKLAALGLIKGSDT